MHNIVSDILAISTDGLSSPSISLKLASLAHGTHPFGWGVGWYPNDGQAAVVTKDPMARDTQVLVDTISDWSSFRSTCFLAKVRGAAKGYTHHETQPFSRSYAGKDWLFVHNGDLDRQKLREIHANKSHFLEPLGKTDSELAFVYLLSRVVEAKVRKLSQVPPRELLEWFETLDALGSADMVITDGQSIVCYHGTNSPRELFYARLLPPFAEQVLEAESMTLRMTDPRDTFRTKLVITSTRFDEGEWVKMEPGQMIVARRGSIVWDTQPDAQLRLNLKPRAEEREKTENKPAPVPTVPKKDFDAIMAEQAQTYHSVVNLRSITSTADGQPLKFKLYDVVHNTQYEYSDEVEHSTHIFRLHPEENHLQEVLHASIAITSPGEEIQFEDVFGNHAIHYSINQPYKTLLVQARSRLKVFGTPPDDHSLSRRQSSIPVVWMPWQQQMMMPYLLPPELPETQLDELYAYAMSFAHRNDFNLYETLKDINLSIYHDYEYVQGTTSLSTSPFEVYASRAGVCQDFTNLFICMARLLNVPARYRMGYIFTGLSYENTIQSEASHAWVELYLPFVGWRGFDPTNGIMAGQDHICVARGRNYRDATPTSGTIFKGGGMETLTVDVKIDEVG